MTRLRVKRRGFSLMMVTMAVAATSVLALAVLANRATDSAGMKPEKRLFGFSILYLFILFAALVADRWIVA